MSGKSRLRAVRTLLAVWLGSVAGAGAGDAWWVWQPSETRNVNRTLAGTKPEAIYWHHCTLKADGSSTFFADPTRDAPCPVVTVVRLEGGAAVLEDPELRAAVEHGIELATVAHPPMVQLDYDCPARLLPKYAGWLRGLKARLAPVRLSITALAGWTVLDAGQWSGAVDEMVPMFYDLWPDEPSRAAAGKFQPLADTLQILPLVAAWRHCPVPWRCGLANFVRVSRFTAQGRQAGHLRAWRTESLLFAEEFGVAEELAAGVLRLPVLRASVAAETKWEPGDWMVVRYPDMTALATMEEAARSAGAAGVVWFQLPSGTSGDGWSPRHLAARATPQPWQGRLFQEGQRLLLTGSEGCDLPLQWAGTPRGWLLEIEAPAACFRDVSAGEFFRMEVRDDMDRSAPLTLARRVRWRFASLAAGNSLRTGAIVLAPGADLPRLRWRVTGPGMPPAWQPVQ